MGARVLALAGTLVVCAPAIADVTPADEARALELFNEGRAILDTNPLEPARIEAACDAFEDSLRLDPQIGTRLNLGDCRERQGRLVEAHALFEASAAEAERDGKIGRKQFAEERAEALAAKLVRVTLHVQDPAQPALTISLSGRIVSRQEWEVPSFVMPGPIVVEVTASDRLPRRIERKGDPGSEVEISILALTAANPDRSLAANPRPQWVPYAIAGGGGVLLLGSIVLGLHAKARYDTAFEAGNRDGVASAQHEADVATVVTIAGVAAIGVGVWMYLRERDRVVVAPTADTTTAGLAVIGQF
jgi:hypothetical protein